MKIWASEIKPHLHQETGTYYSLAAITSSMETQNDLNPDTRKRPSISSPPSLLPATKTARLQQEAATVADSAERTLTKMDAEIAQNFLGML